MYSTFTPKNRQIAERLASKMEPNFKVTQHKQQEIEPRTLDGRYKDAFQKFRVFKSKNEKYIMQLSHDLQRVEDIVFSLERSKTKSSDPYTQMYENFQKVVQSEQAENSEKMSAVRKSMIDDIDKKKKTMKTDAIEIMEQQFEQMCRNNLADIEKKMQMVTASLEEERLSKQESAAFLAETIGEEILKMEQIISQERDARKQLNQSIFEMIDELEEKMEASIGEEIRAREKAEEIVEARLEEVCYRIQSKILGSI